VNFDKKAILLSNLLLFSKFIGIIQNNDKQSNKVIGKTWHPASLILDI